MTAEKIATVRNGEAVLRRCAKMIRKAIDEDTGYVLILIPFGEGPRVMEPLLASNATESTVKSILQSGANHYGKTTYDLGTLDKNASK